MMVGKPQKLRIIHVVGSMNRGGIETWLMQVFRNIDHSRYCFDFLTHTSAPGVFDDEIRSLGGRIITCNRGLGYAAELMQVFRQYGPYDVVHCHVHHFSGLVLSIAQLARIPVRIAHSHSDTSRLDRSSSLLRRAYVYGAKLSINLCSTQKIAASEYAAKALFGDDCLCDSRCKVLYCGIDLTDFGLHREENNARKGLGLRDDAWVIGHVGRFIDVKNHDFLIDLASELAASGRNYQILLVGEGNTKERIQHKVLERNLEGVVVFAGLRSDVPTLMEEVMDVFVLPSHYEGLPLVGIEAQAAGLPCIFSKEITHEIAIVEELCDFLPIDDSSRWAELIKTRHQNGSSVSKDRALERVRSSSFNISVSISQLERCYSA